MEFKIIENGKWINYNDVVFYNEYYLGIESGLTSEEAALNAKNKIIENK